MIGDNCVNVDLNQRGGGGGQPSFRSNAHCLLNVLSLSSRKEYDAFRLKRKVRWKSFKVVASNSKEKFGNKLRFKYDYYKWSCYNFVISFLK